MTDKKITLWINPELMDKLQEESERKAIPITDLINIILFDHFQNTVPE